MVTAMGQQSMVMNAIKAGMRDFIVKSFDGARVMDAVSKLIVRAIDNKKEEGQMEGYCVKCRTKKEIKDAQAITMKNG